MYQNRYRKRRATKRNSLYGDRRFKSRSNYKYSLYQPQGVLTNKGVMPMSLRCKFVFQDNMTISCATGSLAATVLRGNSPYDPDQVGTGTQPPAFDDMSIFYSEYNCYFSTITVAFSVPGDVPINACIYPYYASTDSGISYSAMQSYPYAKSTVLQNQYGGGVTYMKHSMRTTKITGLDSNSTSLWCAFNTNPNAQFFWRVACQPVDESSSVAIVANVKITYYCWLGRRKNTGED